MPRRQDIRTILILGSGPIVIGQGCEFDYSGTQACKALREEGYRVVLVNSNPATIMTDPAFSDRTYIEPITPEAVEKVILREAEAGSPIDAVLPTLGGQTALNCACRLWDQGVLQAHDIELIGADREVINRAEDREMFRRIVESLGLRQPRSRTVTTLDDGRAFLQEIGLPAIIRPAFTLGGTGGGIAWNRDEFDEIVRRGLSASMIGQVLIDQSVLGWKEYELEVVRDANDNCVIVCGIENIDPMGVHTGDSITVAPIMTLSDKEYQRMRDAAIAIMRAVGVNCGGSNVQFAVNPADGEMVVVEMNPRVSRSSALASKATGFPIARIAAKLAVGYTLDELRNDITGNTSACFEPSIDYVVVKMPRWTFEKFPEADETLTTQMKSVGEGMSIGRTFKESLQKAIRSMEVKRFGFGLDNNDKWLVAKRAVESGGLRFTGVATLETPHGLVAEDGSPIEWPIPDDRLVRKLSVPSQGRLYYVRYAMKMGWSIDRIHELTRIDPWFLDQLLQLCKFEDVLSRYRRLEDVPADVLFQAKQLGYSDPQLANLYLGSISTKTILAVRSHRKRLGIEPVYKLVDTCAAEFDAATPYYYATYERGVGTSDDGTSAPAPDDEIRVTPREKIVILGGGPNRIGQGIEFDYCCCQAAFASEEMGFESVMINSNPETVSTDFDTSDLLFFEPLTLEDVLNVIERLNGGGLDKADRSGKVAGCIVQFGGQTPLNLANGLVAAGVPLIGTGLDAIDHAEDRDRFRELLLELGLDQPESGIAHSLEEAIAIAARIEYPVLVRPSYVLGGRGMETCFDEAALRLYMAQAVKVSEFANAPVLIDRFLSEAIELDVDVVADFTPDEATASRQLRMAPGQQRALVCGVMEHIEEAGIHSGDSTAIVPPYSLSPEIVDRARDAARRLAESLRVRGLMNVQMAVKNDRLYVLEVNPRASRTAPFVSKAKGVPWARIAAKVMMGASLEELDVHEAPDTGFYAVKESVFPFAKFPGVDVVLGPEMRSTGEVMGADRSLPIAFAKAQMAAGCTLPTSGEVFVSVRDSDKSHCIEIARQLMAMGFVVHTTSGTNEFLRTAGVETRLIPKISEGARPNVMDMITNGEISLIINTPTRKGGHTDEGHIRALAVRFGVPMITTIAGARATIQAIAALRSGAWNVTAIQDYFPGLARGRTTAKETAGVG
ncbi:MAG: carbamoyl-phosphate synthase large subunit [Phycisphaerales bacterium]|nr:carbamoyl-phosphate synthase large subunit [Phycisphaerales bacterium]